MACYHPMRAYRIPGNDGKWKVTFFKSLPYNEFGEEMQVPCGYCLGCRVDYAYMWSVRCQLEKKLWDHGLFVTVTYSPANLPPHGTIVRKDFTDFLKRIRKQFDGEQCAPDSDKKPIRYFGCGEYGTDVGRPHYHVLLYNLRIWDLVAHDKQYKISKTLSKLWPFGFHTVSAISPRRCSYVSQYAAKKVFSPDKMYNVVDPSTGEVLVEREKEFCAMSLKPGIGQWWFDKYRPELQNGFIVLDGRKVGIPKLFMRKLREGFPEEHAELRYRRQQWFKTHPESEQEKRRRLDVEELEAYRIQESAQERKRRKSRIA